MTIESYEDFISWIVYSFDHEPDAWLLQDDQLIYKKTESGYILKFITFPVFHLIEPCAIFFSDKQLDLLNPIVTRFKFKKIGDSINAMVYKKSEQ